MQLTCCKIGCKELAEYELRETVKSDGGKVAAEDYTHVCLAHIPDLMTDATVHEIVKLVAPGDSTPVYR